MALQDGNEADIRSVNSKMVHGDIDEMYVFLNKLYHSLIYHVLR